MILNTFAIVMPEARLEVSMDLFDDLIRFSDMEKQARFVQHIDNHIPSNANYQTILVLSYSDKLIVRCPHCGSSLTLWGLSGQEPYNICRIWGELTTRALFVKGELTNV